MIIKKLTGKKPLISIITVTKNSEKTIEKCILSVKKQSFKNFEYIIIDGKSSDKSIKIIKKYKNFINHIESKKDKNLWDAMNKGIKVSRGKIIGILNSDDFFYPNALSYVKKYFNENNIDFLFGAVKKKRIYSGFSPERIWYKFNIIPSHSVSFFVKKKIHEEAGLYDASLKYCADYDFLYRILRKNYYGIATKKNHIFGEFSMSGMSSKPNFLTSIYFQSIVRLRNGQGYLWVIFLYFLHAANFIRNKIINFIIKK